MPKVSICIPTYKQVKYLKKNLDSISIQNFKDYEVVITDDSPDKSVENLVGGYDFNGCLKYIRNKFRLGTPENWNECIRMASGEYIKIMHHDDWFVDKDCLGKFVSALDSNPKTAFAFSGAYSVNEKNQSVKLFLPEKKTIDSILALPENLLYGNQIGPPSSTIFKRKVNSTFDRKIKWLVDIDFYISVIKNNRGTIYIQQPLIFSSNNAMHSVTSECQTKEIELFELVYVYDKLKKNEKNYIVDKKIFLSLFEKYDVHHIDNINFNEVTSVEVKDELKKLIAENNKKRNVLTMSNFAKKVRRISAGIWLFFQNKQSELKPLASFSQCGEDLIVNFIFKHYLKIDKPSYIDVGAHHPVYLSNTALFYKNGSKGINVEPNPELYKAFLHKRKRDKNLNVGISDRTGVMEFYVMSTSTMSTFSLEEAKRLEKEHGFKIIDTQKVNVCNLNDIINDHCCNVFPDFLSLDVEGFELLILNSIDFTSCFPKVICIETLSYEAEQLAKKDTEFISFLENKGYMVFADTYINTIFVRKEFMIGKI